MATYYVDGKNGDDRAGNGNSNNPWKTLSKANNEVKPGDTIKARTALYREVVNMNTANVTLMADEGHQPALDGGYNEGLFNGGQLPPPDKYLPGHRFASLLRLTADGTTVDGLIIQNAAGRGIVSIGSRNTIRNCKIDFCYSSGIVYNSGGLKAGLLIENNTITRCSVKYYHDGREGSLAAGAVTIVGSENAIVRHNIVAYSWGEGINCDKDSLNLLVEGNVVHTCNHVHLYIMRSRNTVLRNNFVYHLYLKEHLGSRQRAPAGIAIGDEGGRLAAGATPTSGAAVYNNIVVGMGLLFQVRNNDNNYDTQIEDTYIGYNTFVAGRMTRTCIQIDENLKGRPHRRSIFENNIILSDHGEISKANGNISGIAFRNNLWSETPVGAMRGPGDKIGDPRLANPNAPITGRSPGPTNADPFNYQVTKNSTLAIGSASNGSSFNGLRPPNVERDFFNANRDNKPDLGAHEFGGQTSTISANFSIGPGQQTGAIPHTVDFTDRSTSDAPILKWNWEFGDGSASTERNPVHTYAQPGSFTVSLTIEDQNGQRDVLVEPDMITALPEDVVLSPDSFRRFLLVQDATDNIISFGIQYPDRSCVLLWNSEPFHVLNYATIEDVAEQYEVEGETTLMWLDPVLEPVGLDEFIEREEA